MAAGTEHASFYSGDFVTTLFGRSWLGSEAKLKSGAVLQFVGGQFDLVNGFAVKFKWLFSIVKEHNGWEISPPYGVSKTESDHRVSPAGSSGNF